MDMRRKKKKIITLGLCIGLVALLAVYFGLFADREIPPLEISKVYSLPLGENEEVFVRRIIVSDLTGDGLKEVLMSYDVYSYVKQEVEEGISVMILFKEARMLILSSAAVGNPQKLWEYDSGLTRQTVAIGDFDGDGKPDIVVGGSMVENFMIEDVGDPSASVTPRVEVLLQRENDGFDKVFSSDIAESFGPGLIEAGEFDGDGRTDFIVGGIVAENESPYPAYLFRNEGGGNFTMSPIALKEGVTVMDMWKADINNNDGPPDLIIRALDLDNETYSMILLLNDGRGEFDFRELDISSNLVTIEDFTGNGYPDIIYTVENIQSGDEVYLLRNDQGSFAEPKSINIQNGGKSFGGMMSADFNNDNIPDVLLLEIDEESEIDSGNSEISLIGHLLLIEENAEGEFSFTREWSCNFLEGESISSPYAIAAADINNNGLTDLILVSEDGEIYLVKSTRLE